MSVARLLAQPPEPQTTPSLEDLQLAASLAEQAVDRAPPHPDRLPGDLRCRTELLRAQLDDDREALLAAAWFELIEADGRPDASLLEGLDAWRALDAERLMRLLDDCRLVLDHQSDWGEGRSLEGDGKDEAVADEVELLLTAVEEPASLLVVLTAFVARADPSGGLVSWARDRHNAFLTADGAPPPFSDEQQEALDRGAELLGIWRAWALDVLPPIAKTTGAWAMEATLRAIAVHLEDQQALRAAAAAFEQPGPAAIRRSLEAALRDNPTFASAKVSWTPFPAHLTATLPAGRSERRAAGALGWLNLMAPDDAALYTTIGDLHSSHRHKPKRVRDYGSFYAARYRGVHTSIVLGADLPSVRVRVVRVGREHIGARAPTRTEWSAERQIQVWVDDHPSITLPRGATILDAVWVASPDRLLQVKEVSRNGRRATRDLLRRLEDNDKLRLLLAGDLVPPPAGWERRVARQHLEPLRERLSRLWPADAVAVTRQELGEELSPDRRQPLSPDEIDDLLRTLAMRRGTAHRGETWWLRQITLGRLGRLDRDAAEVAREAEDELRRIRDERRTVQFINDKGVRVFPESWPKCDECNPDPAGQDGSFLYTLSNNRLLLHTTRCPRQPRHAKGSHRLTRRPVHDHHVFALLLFREKLGLTHQLMGALRHLDLPLRSVEARVRGARTSAFRLGFAFLGGETQDRIEQILKTEFRGDLLELHFVSQDEDSPDPGLEWDMAPRVWLTGRRAMPSVDETYPVRELLGEEHFYGRKDELLALEAALTRCMRAGESKILTLLAPFRTGKTVLSLEWMRRRREDGLLLAPLFARTEAPDDHRRAADGSRLPTDERGDSWLTLQGRLADELRTQASLLAHAEGRPLWRPPKGGLVDVVSEVRRAWPTRPVVLILDEFLRCTSALRHDLEDARLFVTDLRALLAQPFLLFLFVGPKAGSSLGLEGLDDAHRRLSSSVQELVSKGTPIPIAPMSEDEIEALVEVHNLRPRRHIVLAKPARKLFHELVAGNPFIARKLAIRLEARCPSGHYDVRAIREEVANANADWLQNDMVQLLGRWEYRPGGDRWIDVVLDRLAANEVGSTPSTGITRLRLHGILQHVCRTRREQLERDFFMRPTAETLLGYLVENGTLRQLPRLGHDGGDGSDDVVYAFGCGLLARYVAHRHRDLASGTDGER